ncbi:uncharacterized protein CXQ87_004370 [Candidozyma duobushaemuli]|uniref:Protein MUM2 n=1 Tax=Candidozyma duobushaemuli TaxID=1231522 RepID=A0A2V1AGU5_9ASCO|nr:uncharacterized protein CXQ87_004370 [[Candida] duobushaemulonis]PVH16814.1 hypothetical protein CXQ87_004370 [[Candida] duobushaemulonis]
MDRTSANTLDCPPIFNTLSSGSFGNSSGYAGSQTEDTDPDFFPLLNDTLNGKSRQSSINASTVSASSIQASPAWTSPQSVSDKFDTAQKISMANYVSNAGFSSSLVSPSVSSTNSFQNMYPMQRSLSITGLGDQYENTINSNYIHRPRADSYVAAPQARYKSVDGSIDLSKKRDIRMAYNNQSYTPSFEKENKEPSASISSKHSSFDGKALKPAKSVSSDKVQALEAELAFQTEMNKSVAEKLKNFKLNKTQASGSNYKDSPSVQMPQKYHQLFKDLTQTLNERTSDLEDTKSRLEAIMVALVMNKGSDIIENGTFDAQEMAHRLVSKLEVLSAENESLQRMVSYSNKQSLLIELNLLREENESLKKTIKEFDKK